MLLLTLLAVEWGSILLRFLNRDVLLELESVHLLSVDQILRGLLRLQPLLTR